MKKLQNLFSYYIASQCLFFIMPLLNTPALKSYNLLPAVIVHSIALFCFFIGYIGKMSVTKRVSPKHTIESYTFSHWLFPCAYLVMLLGIAIVVLQISLFIDPRQYIRALFSGTRGTGIRDAFLTSSSEGGLSGILKILGYAPLSIYLFSLSITNFLQITPTTKHRFIRLNRIALILTVVKIFFALDRLTIIAILAANLFVTFRSRRYIKPLILLTICIILTGLVSQLRVQGGSFDFIVIYSKVSLINLQLLLDTLQGYTLGFSTILSPIGFILDFFGLSNFAPLSSFTVEVFSAQYIVGYAYQDFGPFYFLFFLVLGYIYRKFDHEVIKRGSIMWTSIYFVLLYNTISFIAVPAFRGIDFWFALLLPVVFVKLFAKKVRQPIISSVVKPSRTLTVVT